MRKLSISIVVRSRQASPGPARAGGQQKETKRGIKKVDNRPGVHARVTSIVKGLPVSAGVNGNGNNKPCAPPVCPWPGSGLTSHPIHFFFYILIIEIPQENTLSIFFNGYNMGTSSLSSRHTKYEKDFRLN